MTDLTHWDDVAGSYQPNFNPTRFVVSKASEGTSFRDPGFAELKAKCVAGKHHLAAYHFMHTGDVIAQANFAYSIIKSVPAMLDIEVYSLDKGKTHHWPTIAEVSAFVKEYRRIGGTMNVTYIPQWFWRDNWKGASLSSLGSAGLHNINSNYSLSADPGSGNAALKAFGGLPNLGLQYTSTPHDMNLAYMTFTQLWSVFGGKPPAVAAHQPGSRTLELTTPSMTGPDVLFVQQHIGSQHAGTADSQLGANTEAGIVYWQKQHHLLADGKVGANTWASFGVKYTGP